jgi:hypothetical protein
VRDWLLGTAARGQGSSYGFSGDPDSFAEPVLNLDPPPVVEPPPDPEPEPEPEPEPPPTITTLQIVGNQQSSNATGAKSAYDGDPATAWRTTGTNAPKSAWVRFDLGKKLTINEIRWQFSQIGSADQFKVQVSSNGSTWQTLATRGNAATAGAWEILATDVAARYVRFYFDNPNKDAKLGYLSEVQIAGLTAAGGKVGSASVADRDERTADRDRRQEKDKSKGKPGKKDKKDKHRAKSGKKKR